MQSVGLYENLIDKNKDMLLAVRSKVKQQQHLGAINTTIKIFGNLCQFEGAGLFVCCAING